MTSILRLAIVFLASAFIPLASVGAQTFPANHPVMKFVVPPNWTTEVDKADGSISINSKDGRVSVNFGEVPVAASIELFEKILPAMVTMLKDATVAEKVKTYSENGLSGFTATYIGKVADEPMRINFLLFKAGANRSVLGNIVVSQTLPKEDEAIKNFMKSLKGTAQK